MYRLILLSLAVVFCVAGIFMCLLYVLNRAPESSHVSVAPEHHELYVIGNGETDEPLNVTASTVPQFAVSLADEKYKEIWQVQDTQRQSYVSSTIQNAKGDVTLPVDATFQSSNKQVIFTPKMANSVKPGLYMLNVKMKTYTGEDTTITQNFMWGVLAINTDKGIYSVGDKVSIGMAVLDEFGSTKCIARDGVIVYGTAKVHLTVTSPSGSSQSFSTDDGTITGSKSCADRSVTDDPDFFTSMTAQESGTYTIHMEAQTFLGTHTLDGTFTVQKNAPAFEITRTKFPTRIYPRSLYPVVISVKANKDYSGIVYDILPSQLVASDISDTGTVVTQDSYNIVEWNVDWKKGQTYTLFYTLKFPPVAPEFYLIGPFTIGHVTEGREWQVASDSIFNIVQEAHNTANSTTVSTNFATTPTQNDLLVDICYRTSSSTFSRPTGWSSVTNTSATTPRMYEYYRIAPASASTTVSCSTSSSGVIAVQALEFSGNSTSGVLDKSRTVSGSTTCASGGFHNATNSSVAPTNPDELLVSAFAATGTTSVASHANGYVDTSSGSFQGSGPSGTFDSGWLEAINNPPVAVGDVATYNASGTRCSNILGYFNAQITFSQGSYQFFDNINAINPVTTFGSGATGVNTPISLNSPNQQFRVRMLLDVDSPSGTVEAIDGLDLILEYAPLPSSGDCADGVYNQVLNVSDGTPIAFSSNSGVAEGSVISSSGSDPSDTGYTTQFENYYGNDNASAGLGYSDMTNDNTTLGNNQAGLWDFSLIDNTNDSNSVTYCLILTNGDGSLLNAYRNYPKVTTIINDVDIRSGTKIQSGVTLR